MRGFGHQGPTAHSRTSASPKRFVIASRKGSCCASAHSPWWQVVQNDRRIPGFVISLHLAGHNGPRLPPQLPRTGGSFGERLCALHRTSGFGALRHVDLRHAAGIERVGYAYTKEQLQQRAPSAVG